MPVLIGSARTDENGNDYGGQAGDQTGHEVETQEWYLHPKGWIVIRAKKKEVAECIAKDVEYACLNDNVGYDQWQANSLYNKAKHVGFDIKRVTEPCETHCAALIRVSVCYAGVECDIKVLIDCPDFYTATEAATLEKTGEFDILTDPKYTEHWEWLRRGDILVTKTKGHTVGVLQDGPEAYDDEPAHATLYRTTGTVYIRTGPSKNYPTVGVVPRNELVYVYSIQDGWAKSSYKDTEGYISMKYLTEADRRYYTTGNVWMRKTFGIIGLPIEIIKAGTFVTATGKTASVLGTPWYEVMYDGKVGWCSGKYLQKCS